MHTGWLDSRIAARIKPGRPPWHISVIAGGSGREAGGGEGRRVCVGGCGLAWRSKKMQHRQERKEEEGPGRMCLLGLEVVHQEGGVPIVLQVTRLLHSSHPSPPPPPPAPAPRRRGQVRRRRGRRLLRVPGLPGQGAAAAPRHQPHAPGAQHGGGEGEGWGGGLQGVVCPRCRSQ